MSAVVEPAGPTARVRKGSDIAFTITLIVFTIIAWFVGAGVSLAGLIFFGSCNGGGCSGDALINGGIILIVLGGLGILASIVMLIIKRRAWPVALITLGVVVIGWIAANLIDGIR